MQATSSRGRHRASVAYISLSFSGCHHTSYETSPYEQGDITIQVTSSREHQHVPPHPHPTKGGSRGHHRASLYSTSLRGPSHIIPATSYQKTSLCMSTNTREHHLHFYKLKRHITSHASSSKGHLRTFLGTPGNTTVHLSSAWECHPCVSTVHHYELQGTSPVISVQYQLITAEMITARNLACLLSLLVLAVEFRGCRNKELLH